MADKPQPSDVKLSTPDPSAATASVRSGSFAVSASPTLAPRADMRDAMAEMAERAQQIGHEAATKVASAMRDVIGATAGLAGFAVESARDLVQYMVRRGQMTQDEADKLIRDAEEAQGKRSPTGNRAAASKTTADRTAAGTKPSTSRDGASRAEQPKAASVASAPKPSSTAKMVAAKRPSGASTAKSAKKPATKAASAEKKTPSKKAAPKKRR